MRSTVRSLAAEAKLSVRVCLDLLRHAGLHFAVGGQRLQGEAWQRARAALGLPEPRPRAAGASRPLVNESEMIVRLLRPLRQKGKLGREHTTPLEHVFGHGVPDHLKAEAKARAAAVAGRAMSGGEGKPGPTPHMADRTGPAPAGGGGTAKLALLAGRRGDGPAAADKSMPMPISLPLASTRGPRAGYHRGEPRKSAAEQATTSDAKISPSYALR
jgi:hypothetical protein